MVVYGKDCIGCFGAVDMTQAEEWQITAIFIGIVIAGPIIWMCFWKKWQGE